MLTIRRKSLLYRTGVEYGDFTINHVLGCSHGCMYPCYAFMMARRFGRVRNYADWIQPRLVENSIDLLKKEIPKYRNKIKSVHLCFTTDPFMVGYPEIKNISLEIIRLLDAYGIKCTVFTKGVLPNELANFSKNHIWGISLVSLNEAFRKQYEPFTSTYIDRIEGLKFLHDQGYKTWASLEPYPTPNIQEQSLDNILEAIGFVDKIVFGRLHYNSQVTKYHGNKFFYNSAAEMVVHYCKRNGIEYHIKTGTIVKSEVIHG